MKIEDINKQFAAFAERMLAEGVPDIAISHFKKHYQQLCEGETGIIPESDIVPVTHLPDADALSQQYSDIGSKQLVNTVLIKLNGGLGTSMGLERAKSLITVKEDQSFLDIIVRHTIQARSPLLLMNSFITREDSYAILDNYPDLKKFGIALDFLQHRVPKISQETLEPASCHFDEQLAWCPPGHGDIYIALVSSGMLDSLLKTGYQYAFISNADNLGATLDTALLGYLIKENIPFLMEVTERTDMDKKGGHLAMRKDGRLLLRETAQCAEEDKTSFEDISKHRYFNTNNLWLDLQALKDTLAKSNNNLHLPLIRNVKTLDPRDATSQSVYQLESAMGSAISSFDKAAAISVSRNRFAPVKTTNELLLVRSDVYTLEKHNYTLHRKQQQVDMPVISLDKRYYKLIDDLESRFPHGPPSLLRCTNLQITGDIKFGKDVSLEGDVKLENRSDNQISIPDNTTITEETLWE